MLHKCTPNKKIVARLNVQVGLVFLLTLLFIFSVNSLLTTAIIRLMYHG